MDEKDIHLAEAIAYRVNLYIYNEEPDFKALCDTYVNTYMYLKKFVPEIKDDLKELYGLMRQKIYHDTMRGVLPAVHIYGQNPFLYLHEDYILRETEIDALIKKIRTKIPPHQKPFFQKFIKSVQCMHKWYEQKLYKRTLKFMDKCYKYYC